LSNVSGNILDVETDTISVLTKKVLNRILYLPHDTTTGLFPVILDEIRVGDGYSIVREAHEKGALAGQSILFQVCRV
jgi:hypothetical protein